MSKAEPESLQDCDPVLADYTAALRDVETPTPERAQATWTAVEAATRQRSRLWIPIVLAAAAVILGIVFVGPPSMMEREQTGRPKQTPYRTDGPATGGHAESRPRPAPAATSKSEVPSPEVALPEPPTEVATEPAPASAPAPAPKRPTPSKEAPPAGPSSLAQETSLLRDIQRAQAAKEHSRVLELTHAHRQRFPKGTFAAERSLARVRSLCALGRAADARKAGQDFIRKHPRSHLVSQFESACPL